MTSHRPRTGAFDPAVRADDAMGRNEEIDRRLRHRGRHPAMR
jgi:hypothetical protein